MKKIDFPLPEDSLRSYAESIFTPISRDECVTSVWVPMAGRRTCSEFVIDNIDLFKEYLPGHEKYILVYLDPVNLMDDTMSGYLLLMYQRLVEAYQEKIKDLGDAEAELSLNIFDEQNFNYAKLLKGFTQIIEEISAKNYRIVFFFGEFDQIDFVPFIFFGNLRSLWDKMYPYVHYVFLLQGSVTNRKRTKLWGGLNELTMQNVHNVPLLDAEESEYVIQRYLKSLNYDLSQTERDLLYKYCFGHPYMLRIGIRILKNNDNKSDIQSLFEDNLALNHVVRGVVTVWDEREISSVNRFLNLGGKRSEIVTTFETVGIIRQVGGRYTYTNELIRKYINKNYKLEETDISYDEVSGRIIINDKSMEQLLTPQEYSVMKHFLSNKDVIVTRDEIAFQLWGSDREEKYSDWAIDQLMSKLRKKLKEVSGSNYITTVRGRGYKLQI